MLLEDSPKGVGSPTVVGDTKFAATSPAVVAAPAGDSRGRAKRKARRISIVAPSDAAVSTANCSGSLIRPRPTRDVTVTAEAPANMLLFRVVPSDLLLTASSASASSAALMASNTSSSVKSSTTTPGLRSTSTGLGGSRKPGIRKVALVIRSSTSSISVTSRPRASFIQLAID